jgi:hypothetical protein
VSFTSQSTLALVGAATLPLTVYTGTVAVCVLLFSLPLPPPDPQPKITRAANTVINLHPCAGLKKRYGNIGKALISGSNAKYKQCPPHIIK